MKVLDRHGEEIVVGSRVRWIGPATRVTGEIARFTDSTYGPIARVQLDSGARSAHPSAPVWDHSRSPAVIAGYRISDLELADRLVKAAGPPLREEANDAG